MKFNDWLDRVQKQQNKVENLAICDIIETISADGNHFSITIGTKLHAEINNNDTDLRYFRPYYTHNKPEFDAMLESIEERAKELVTVASVILKAVTDEAIPGKVLERMTGETNVTSEPDELLEEMVEKKYTQLREDFNQEAIDTVEMFKITLLIGEKKLSLEYNKPPYGMMMGLDVSNLQKRLDFLAAIPLIKSKLQRLLICFKEIKAIKEG